MRPFYSISKVCTTLIFCLSIFLFADYTQICAQETTIQLETQLGVGIQRGLIGEYVYYNNRTLSELLWHVDYLWYYSFVFNVKYSIVTLGVQISHGINTWIGNLEDSDWVNDAQPTVKTNYSFHDNYCERYAKYIYFIRLTSVETENFSLMPQLGFQYTSIKMSAQDGYLEYPPGSPKIPMYGIGIIYEQCYYIPFLGIGANFNASDVVALNVAFAYGILTYAQDIDNHVKRDMDFIGSFENFLYLALMASCKFSLLPTFYIQVQCGYEFVPEHSGSFYAMNNKTGIKTSAGDDSAGISYSVYSILISCGYVVDLIF